MLKERIPEYLTTNGDTVYLVGGAVRDLLCGRRPLDFDIVVPENPGAKAAQLALSTRGHFVKLGRDRFPLFRVVHKTGTIDVTAIKGGSIEADLRQRDFTVNAIAYDLCGHRLIDPLKGVDDLNRRLVRMSTPDSFNQDPVRLVRAHRLAAGLRFTIDPTTSRRINRQAALIGGIAGERIWPELKTILSIPDSSIHIEAMSANGLLAALFTEGGLRDPDSEQHSLILLTNLEKMLGRPEAFLPEEAIDFIKKLTAREHILAKMAALLHNLDHRCPNACGWAAPIDDGINTEHPEKGIIAVCRRLRTSIREQNWISFVVGHLRLPLMAYHYPQKIGTGRFFKQCGVYAPHILMLCLAEIKVYKKANTNELTGILNSCNKLIKRYFKDVEIRLSQPPLIGGRELMDVLGLTPSPLIGELTTMLEEARLEGKIGNKAQAITLAKDYMDRHG